MLDDVAVPELSVIICTRDRPAQLLQCLGSLRMAAGACPDLSFEVVVVENGSRDQATLDATRLAEVAPRRTRLFRLSQGGLSTARNFGMASARGALFAFVDDDCLVDRHWCADALRLYRDGAAA